MSSKVAQNLLQLPEFYVLLETSHGELKYAVKV